MIVEKFNPFEIINFLKFKKLFIYFLILFKKEKNVNRIKFNKIIVAPGGRSK